MQQSFGSEGFPARFLRTLLLVTAYLCWARQRCFPEMLIALFNSNRWDFAVLSLT